MVSQEAIKDPRARQNGAPRARRIKHPTRSIWPSMLDWLLPDGIDFLQNAFAWQYQMVAQMPGLFGAVLGVVRIEAPDRRLRRSRCSASRVVPVRSYSSTYQGFMGALTRWTATLMEILWPLLHERMEEIGGTFWCIHGWVPIAFDGSRSTAPQDESPTSGLSVPNTTGKARPPSTARRRPKACGEKTMRRTSRSRKSRKLGSLCCGIWAFAFLGCGGWAPRIRANELT